MELSRAHTRRLLEAVLISDSDLDAFCLDNFPGVYRRFSAGMDRVRKHNLLLEQGDLRQIVAALQRMDPVRFEQIVPALAEQEAPAVPKLLSSGLLAPTSGDYQYDVFLSYCRKRPALDWVQNHFYWRLEGLLGDCLPHSPKIFMNNQEAENVYEWPPDLKEALKNSRCLVAVWSPEYFRSPLCVAGLKSMMARQDLLGHRLVCAVTFADGRYFPSYTQGMPSRDMQEWNFPDQAFAKTRRIVGFHKAMKELAEELAGLVLQAPPWREDFPIVDPEPTAASTVPLPRLP